MGEQESVINSLITFGLAHGMIIIGGIGHPWFNAPFPMGSMMYEDRKNEEIQIKFRHVKHDTIANRDAEVLGKRMGAIGLRLFK